MKQEIRKTMRDFLFIFGRKKNPTISFVFLLLKLALKYPTAVFYTQTKFLLLLWGEGGGRVVLEDLVHHSTFQFAFK